MVRGRSLFDRARYKLSQFAHEDANSGRRRFPPRSISTLLLFDIGSDKPFESVRRARVSSCQVELLWGRV